MQIQPEIIMLLSFPDVAQELKYADKAALLREEILRC